MIKNNETLPLYMLYSEQGETVKKLKKNYEITRDF